MKKLLASVLAITMVASMLTACGDSDSSSKAESKSEAETTTTTTTTAEETTTTTEAEPEPEPADSSSEGGDTTAAATGFKPFAEIKDSLADYDNCSLKFAADTDVNAFAEMFNEAVENKNKKSAHNGETLYPGDEGYTGDEALLTLSVQEVGGIPMMKVDQTLYEDDFGDTVPKTIKLRYDMNKLFAGHEEDMEKIFTIKADVVAIARDNPIFDDGSQGGLGVYWYGGAFGTNNDGEWNGNLIEYSGVSSSSTDSDDVEWINQWAYMDGMQIRPGIQDPSKKATFGKDYETNYLTLMVWQVTNNIDLYIADITFLDENNNVIAVPEENIPGGAAYDEGPLEDATADGIVPRDADGNVTYDESVILHGPYLNEQ
ncbi:MAG: hypothetical protein IJ571_10170 [Ruminococcus sp.]|nr:hypothetical protein [Ruminococcus sp.]